MKENSNNVLSRLILFAAVFSALLYGPLLLFANEWFLPAFPLISALTVGVTAAILISLSQAGNAPVAVLYRKFMVWSMAKMGLYLLFLVVWLMNRPQEKIPVVAFMAANYIAFSYYEIRSLLKSFKNNS